MNNQFSNFGFKKFINDGLQALSFTNPTPCQTQVIPKLLKHQNVICQSQTGTGKTHAFILPILNNLNYEDVNIQAVIITPTRELAKQIYQNLNYFKTFNPQLRTACFVGGEDCEAHKEQLLSKSLPQVIVGTPKRLRSLFEMNVLPLTLAKTFVIDECDMIFDLNFMDDVDYMLSKANKQIKVSVFSATISENMYPFLKKYLVNPHIINITQKEIVNKNIEHVLVLTKQQEKVGVLEDLVKTFDPYLCLIFVNKKSDIQKYYDALLRHHRNVVQLHADLQPRERTQILKRINNLEYKYVVCSDVAARGIDIKGVSHVISVDLPHDLEYYIHRSGRTGRGQYTGFSYVLFDLRDQNLVDQLTKKGVKFRQVRIVNHQLIDVRGQNGPVHRPYNEKKLTKTQVEVNKVVKKYKAQNKKVKPNYRKKMQAEISAVKSKIRREHIQDSIKKIKKDRAKKRQLELMGDE